MKLSQGLFVALACSSGLLFAQEKPILSESKSCRDGKTAIESCKPEDVLTERAFTEGEKAIYRESYEPDGKLSSVRVTLGPTQDVSCSMNEGGRLECSGFTIAALQNSLEGTATKARAMKAYHSDADLAKALGQKEEEIKALGIDWRFAQVVVWVAKTPAAAAPLVVQGGAPRFTASKKSGAFTIDFTSSCPGGRSVGSAAELNVVVALLPSYFTVKSATTKLKNVGGSAASCKKGPPRP